MLGQFKLKGKEIKFETFSYYNKFIDAIESRPTNWKSTIDYDATFEGVESWEDAKNILYNGSDKLKKEVYSKLNVKSEKLVKIRSCSSIVGQRVSIPRFLDNKPKCMIKKTNVAKKAKLLKIVIDGDISAMYSASEVLQRANILFNFFNYLQKENYIYKSYVSYNFAHFDEKNETGYSCLLKVKESNEKLSRLHKNLLLCLPSTFRVLMFKWYETFPGAKRISGYGRPLGKQRAYVDIGDYYSKMLNIDTKEEDLCIICLSNVESLDDLIQMLENRQLTTK